MMSLVNTKIVSSYLMGRYDVNLKVHVYMPSEKRDQM